MPITSDPKGRRRALIIGGSVTGMSVARVLREHYDEVVIIERDDLSSELRPRRGVPQSAQPHGLQMRGRAELDELFPGYVETVKQGGGNEVDLGSEMARYTPWGWAPTHPVQVKGLLASRPLMETTIRDLLLRDCPEIRWLKGVRVSGLRFEHVQGIPRVYGVETDSKDESLRYIDAELVVDASGRGSKALRWFKEMGLPRPEEWRADSHSNYATRHYRRPDAASKWWWKAMMVDAVTPDIPSACSIFSVEDDTWIVTAMGMDGQYVPTNEKEWLQHIANLRSPAVSEVIALAEPKTDVIQSRSTHNIWRQMHRWKGEVDGLLLAGDAIGAFNPLYGQGITSAVVGAALLRDLLDAQKRKTGQVHVDHRFARRFYKKHGPILALGWSYSTTFDYRWRSTTGKRPLLVDLQNWMGAQLSEVAMHDAKLFCALAPLLDFGAKPLSVITPAFVGRVWMGFAKRLLTGRPQPLGPGALPLMQEQVPPHHGSRLVQPPAKLTP